MPQPALDYREYPPHPVLARHVECYWCIRADFRPPRSERVLPDGCIDILFGLSDCQTGPEPKSRAPTVVGTMTSALDVTYRGSVHLLGVRFKPGGAGPFIEIPASELTDSSAQLADLWGRSFDHLEERLAATADLGSRITILNHVLMQRLRRAADRADEVVFAASEAFTSTSGMISVDQVATLVGLKRRQLERRFLTGVGVPPKVAARVARFRKAVHLFHARPLRSLSRMAHELGYADQSHFNREFREFAGMTPGVYRRGLAGP